jgi:homoserine dehydrogenase
VAVTRVIKVGGSLLRDGDAYGAIARRLAPELATPTWVVVSAAHGVTDRLRTLAESRDLAQADAIARQHAAWGLPPALQAELLALAPHAPRDAVLAWGERASAALLQARLRAAGRRVPVVELRGRGRLPDLPSAIVPGFYLRDRAGRRRLLPRGGSDITALLVAAWTGAPSVHLWKDGGGIRLGDAIAPTLRSRDLLARIGSTIHPLHPAAARIAQRRGIALVLEDPWGRHASTTVRDPVRGERALEAA